MLLEGKKAVVTGGTRGIGFAIVETFLKNGASVALFGSRQETVDKALAKLKAENPDWDVIGMAPDLTDYAAVDAAMAKVTEAFGRIDILVNNAGIAWFGLLTDMTDEDWSSLLQTNLSSVFYCCRAAIPHMVSVKCGRIINISSMWGTAGASCEAAYSATKSGIHGLTKALAKELAPSNIQVNAIACGVIDTEMSARLNEEERAALAEEIPSGRFSSPEEVAELVLLLCSSPSYMTGQIIGMDGGFI